MKRSIATRLGLAGALLLGACDGPRADFDLEGEWAWHGPENCGPKGNSIQFGKGTLVARIRGIPVVDAKDVIWSAERRGLGTMVVISYNWQGQIYEDSYRAIDKDHLAFRSALIDGKVNQQAQTLEERQLVRCTSGA